MDDHRPVLVVVVPDVDQPEALGSGVVELDRSELPGPADRVGDVEVDLGTVERAVTRLELVGLPGRLERGLERGFGAIPQ